MHMLPRSSRLPFAPICFLSRARLNPWSHSLRASRGRGEERNSPDRPIDLTMKTSSRIRVWTGSNLVFPCFARRSLWRKTNQDGVLRSAGVRVRCEVTSPCARQPRPVRQTGIEPARCHVLAQQLVRCACESRSVLIPGAVWTFLRNSVRQAVTLRGHGDEVSAAGTENRTNEPFSDDGRHACRWWWCRAEGRRRTRTYDWHGTAES
jgi:hypothetical protein